MIKEWICLSCCMDLHEWSLRRIQKFGDLASWGCGVVRGDEIVKFMIVVVCYICFNLFIAFKLWTTKLW